MKINDYFWQLPHTATADDPDEITLLQQDFFSPVVNQCQNPLEKLGFDKAGCDIIIPPDTEVQLYELMDIFRVNVRFLKTYPGGIFTRIHFLHLDWHHLLPTKETHRYLVFVDHYKVADRVTQRLDESWDRRKHISLSTLPGELASGEHDAEWVYTSSEGFKDQLKVIMTKISDILSFHSW